jgi:cytochrome bd-type quinol oxidase subunit 1
VTLFGKYVSVAVLISFLVAVGTAVGGSWIAVVNQWGKTDPASYVVIVLGVIATTVTAAVHTWDTMPNNTPAAQPKLVKTVTYSTDPHANQAGQVSGNYALYFVVFGIVIVLIVLFLIGKI